MPLRGTEILREIYRKYLVFSRYFYINVLTFISYESIELHLFFAFAIAILLYFIITVFMIITIFLV